MPESVRVYEFRTPELTRGGAIVRAEEDNAGNVIFGYALCSMSDVFDPHGAMCKQVLRERLRNEHEDPSNEDLVENLWTPLQIRRAFDNEERYFEFELMRVRSFIRLMWMHYCRKHDHKPPRLRLNLKRGWGQALHSRYKPKALATALRSESDWFAVCESITYELQRMEKLHG